jgi:hypothetical protein
VSVTGVILDFPNWNQGRELMQQANVVHGVAAIIFVGISFGHTYLGTIGLPGAYGAMHDGYVDETWAKEHHGIWYEEVKAGKRVEKFVPGSVQPVAETTDGHQAHAVDARSRRLVCASLAWAKLPPPPPLDEKGKAAAEEKKAKDAAAAEKAKADQAAAEERRSGITRTT